MYLMNKTQSVILKATFHVCGLIKIFIKITKKKKTFSRNELRGMPSSADRFIASSFTVAKCSKMRSCIWKCLLYLEIFICFPQPPIECKAALILLFRFPITCLAKMKAFAHRPIYFQTMFFEPKKHDSATR